MPSSAEAVCVDPARITEIWPHVQHYIRAAMKRGDLGRFSDLERAVLTGNALLWLVWRDPVIAGAAVTQIIETECSRVCMLQALGGSQFAQWANLIEPIEQYARNEHCDAVRFLGRKGWARLMRNYKTTRIVLERSL